MGEVKPGDAMRLKSGGNVTELRPGDVVRLKCGGDTNEVKLGDVVRLKSGGPRMTVNSFPDNERKVQCRWFGKGINEDRTVFEFFAVDTLVPEKDDKPGPAAAESQAQTEPMTEQKPAAEAKPPEVAKKDPVQDKPLAFD